MVNDAALPGRVFVRGHAAETFTRGGELAHSHQQPKQPSERESRLAFNRCARHSPGRHA